MRRSSPCSTALTHSRGEQEGNQEREDRHMHILVVEDDERLARHLARVLTEERHTVEVVGDGKQAILHAQGSAAKRPPCRSRRSCSSARSRSTCSRARYKWMP